MAYTIKTDLDVKKNIVVQGKVVGVNISTDEEVDDKQTQYYANTSGHIQIPIPTKSDVDYIFKQLPLTQFGAVDTAPLSVSYSGYVVTFNSVIPMFMGGQFFEILSGSTINLTTFQSSPANSLFYVYITLVLGVPTYNVSKTAIAESAICAYIGTIQTGANAITSLNLNKVSRFDVYRPSTTQIGSSFPVSTGNPQDTGTINW